MKLIFFLIVVSCSWVSSAQESEEQFEKAYSEYWSKPVENWDNIANQKQTEVYVIRNKDTLSELSQVFFGTPNYWPKIWSLNSYIGNPHIIYPGNKVGFSMGSVDGAAPQVVFEDIKEKEISTSSIYALDSAQVKLPPPIYEKPVLNDFPKSFPVWTMSAADKKSMEIYDNRPKTALEKNVMTFDLTAFLHQGELKTFGEVKGFLNVDAKVASTYDEVFIKSSEPLAVGDTFTLIIPRKKVNSFNLVLKDAYIYEYVGEVKIISNEVNGSGLISGRITNSRDLVDKGALLILGEVPKYDLSYNPKEIKSVDAKIIRGSNIFGHNILGVGQTVFLSQGETAGLIPGSVVQIQQNRAQRNPEQEVVDIVNDIGVVKVVLSTADLSTGIVVSGRDFMAPGDKTIK